MVQRLELKGVKPERRLLWPNWVSLELIRPQERYTQIKNSYRNELGVILANWYLCIRVP